jgi:hypothetical protein
MAHAVFQTVLAVMLSLPLVAIAYSYAPAQERASYSQARSSCATGIVPPLADWLFSVWSISALQLPRSMTGCRQI